MKLDKQNQSGTQQTHGKMKGEKSLNLDLSLFDAWKKFQTYSPKWRAMMVIYNGRIRKKSPKKQIQENHLKFKILRTILIYHN